MARIKEDSNYKRCLSEAHLVCSLCEGKFKQPVVLPCFHTFCSGCLENLPSTEHQDAIICPVCVSEFPRNIKNDLPVIRFLQTLQEVMDSKRFESRSCESCEQDKYAVWECRSCHVNLCGTCRQTHCEKKGKKNHKSFQFLDVSVKEICQRRNDFYCEQHPKEILAYYCATCISMICVVCESTSHEHHDKLRLSEKAEELRGQLTDAVDQFGEICEQLRSSLNSEKEKKKIAAKHASKTELAIREWVERLKDQIDMKAAEILEEVEVYYATTFAKQAEVVSVNRLAKLGRISHFPQQLGDYGSDAEVIMLANSVSTRLKQLQSEEDTDVLPPLEFIPELKSSKDQIISIGRKSVRSQATENPSKVIKAPDDDSIRPRQNSTSPIVQSSVPSLPITGSRVVASFKAHWDVTGIAVTPQNEYLINSRLRKACLMYKPTGELIREVKSHLLTPFDVTVLETGNFVITDREAKNVKVYSPDGTYVETLKLEIGEPGGIASLACGDLVISDLKGEDVCIFSPNRKMFPIRSLKTENGNNSFKWPSYVTVNDKDEIIVSDNELHCVKAFDLRGKLYFRYGNCGEDGEKLRGPRGVCTDSRGNIFVADYTNDKIHMLSPTGKYIRVLVDREDGISGPRVVTMDTVGRLVVGQENATIKLIEYSS